MKAKPQIPVQYWEDLQKIKDPKKNFEYFQNNILQSIFEQFESEQEVEREIAKIKFISRVKETIAIAKVHKQIQTESLSVTWDDNFIRKPGYGKNKIKTFRITKRSINNRLSCKAGFENGSRYYFLNNYEVIKYYRIVGYLYEALYEMLEEKVILEAVVDCVPTPGGGHNGGWDAKLVFKF